MGKNFLFGSLSALAGIALMSGVMLMSAPTNQTTSAQAPPPPPGCVHPAGDTITVPSDCPTIQEAVDIAVAGDTVEVLSGSYAGFQVGFKNDLTIKGLGYPTIVSPSANNAYAIDMYLSDNITLEGFNVACHPLFNPAWDCNAGIKTWNLHDSVITKNKVPNFFIAGILAEVSNNLEISNNDIGGIGVGRYGIISSVTDGALIEKNDIRDCCSNAGMVLEVSSDLTVTKNSLDSVANGWPGASFTSGITLFNIADSEISENSITNYATNSQRNGGAWALGLLLQGAFGGATTGNLIEKNEISSYIPESFALDGVGQATFADGTIDNNVFSKNKIDVNSVTTFPGLGGFTSGIAHLENNAEPSLLDNTFEKNNIKVNGECHFNLPAADYLNNVFTENKPSDEGCSL